MYRGLIKNCRSLDIKYKKLPYKKSITYSTENLSLSEISKLLKTVLKKYIIWFQKSKTPSSYHINLIYKILCLACQDCYKGNTLKLLKQRALYHKTDYRLGKNKCAVVEHNKKIGHNFDYDKIKILEKECNFKCRLFLQNFHFYFVLFLFILYFNFYKV